MSISDDLSGLKDKLKNVVDEFTKKLEEIETKEYDFIKIVETVNELVTKKTQ